jgi:hypothetical protein
VFWSETKRKGKKGEEEEKPKEKYNEVNDKFQKKNIRRRWRKSCIKVDEKSGLLSLPKKKANRKREKRRKKFFFSVFLPRSQVTRFLPATPSTMCVCERAHLALGYIKTLYVFSNRNRKKVK